MSINTNPTVIGLIVMGLLAPLLYGAIVIVGAAIRPGYRHVANAVSELVEWHAPHRLPLNVTFFAYNLLTIGFGLGMTVLAANPTIRLSGWILAANGALGLAMSWFPMDPIGSPSTARGKGHLVIAALMSLGSMATILLFAIGCASVPGWAGISVYSYVSFAVVLMTGAVAALSAGGHWPTMGLWERLTIGGYLQWQAVLAIAFLTN